MLVVVTLRLGHKSHIKPTAFAPNANASAVGVGNNKNDGMIPTTETTISVPAKRGFSRIRGTGSGIVTGIQITRNATEIYSNNAIRNAIGS